MLTLMSSWCIIDASTKTIRIHEKITHEKCVDPLSDLDIDLRSERTGVSCYFAFDKGEVCNDPVNMVRIHNAIYNFKAGPAHMKDWKFIKYREMK